MTDWRQPHEFDGLEVDWQRNVMLCECGLPEDNPLHIKKTCQERWIEKTPEGSDVRVVCGADMPCSIHTKDTHYKKALEWIVGDDTGISSKTIWSVMMGVAIDRADKPYDPSDFGRCYRLLKLIPEWRNRLEEVSKTYPQWKGLVENWSELEALWEEESPSGTAPKLYQRIQKLTEGNA